MHFHPTFCHFVFFPFPLFWSLIFLPTYRCLLKYSGNHIELSLRKHRLYQFSLLLPCTLFRSNVCHTALCTGASPRPLLPMPLVQRTHLPAELTPSVLFPDLWNYIKCWPFLHPQNVSLLSYCFSHFSLIPSEWFTVIYSKLPAVGHKPNPAGFGDQNGVPRGQTVSDHSRATYQCLLQNHSSATRKDSYCALGKLMLHTNIQYRELS